MEGDSSRERANKDALYKVAYDEAARALSEQLTAIDNLRGRAGFLLSAAAIATSVLSGQALTNGSSSAFLWLALASFIAVAAASVAILWPRLAEFTADPSEIILSYIEAENPAPIQKLHRDLSLHMHRSYVGNLTALTRLAMLFQIASGLLIAEMGFWAIAIVSST